MEANNRYICRASQSLRHGGHQAWTAPTMVVLLAAITQVYRSNHSNRRIDGISIVVVKVNCALSNLDLRSVFLNNRFVSKRLNPLGDLEMLVRTNLRLDHSCFERDWIQSRFRFTAYASQDQLDCFIL